MLVRPVTAAVLVGSGIAFAALVGASQVANATPAPGAPTAGDTTTPAPMPTRR